LNIDTNFDFVLIIEFSIKPSRDPTSDSPPPHDHAMGRDLNLGNTEVGGNEYFSVCVLSL